MWHLSTSCLLHREADQISAAAQQHNASSSAGIYQDWGLASILLARKSVYPFFRTQTKVTLSRAADNAHNKFLHLRSSGAKSYIP